MVQSYTQLNLKVIWVIRLESSSASFYTGRIRLNSLFFVAHRATKTTTPRKKRLNWRKIQWETEKHTPTKTPIFAADISGWAGTNGSQMGKKANAPRMNYELAECWKCRQDWAREKFFSRIDQTNLLKSGRKNWERAYKNAPCMRSSYLISTRTYTL